MSTERFVKVRKDGTIWLQEDNDGWTYVNRGSEPREWQVTLDHKYKSSTSSIPDQGIVLPFVGMAQP